MGRAFCKLLVCLSPGPPEGQAVLLTGQAHRGGVHDGHELLDVRGQQAIEELFVPVLQRHQQDVPEGETPRKASEAQTSAAASRPASEERSLTCPEDWCESRSSSSRAALAHPVRGSRAAAGRGCPAVNAPPV